jgi:hypothetical protein
METVPPLVCFGFLWVSVVSTVGLFLFSMSVCQFHRWFVFVFYECLSVPPLVCFCFLSVSNQLWHWQTLIENKNKPTVEPTDTDRKQKQTNGGTDRHSVGLFLFSMSVCRFHRWFVFVFYECLSFPPLVCFCFQWVSVGSTVDLFNKPTVEPTDTHRKQKQTNGGTDKHS